MKTFVVGLLLLGFLNLGAQNRKVEMYRDVPVSEIFSKAKKQHKYVLLDFGSPRCSPCLYIKNKVFTVDSVADFINANFVTADYTQGEEKKRLSGIYQVYTEPVLLITDTKGRLLHRMEGKCEAPEMIARLKQGLDPKRNLVALQKRYREGERTPEFLIEFLEALHVAGLREEKAEVLENIFSPGFDVSLLKKTEYWNLFLRYNESPVSREAIYIFEHRNEFYQLFGELQVNAKINQMYGSKVRLYTYGKVPPIENEEYRQLLSLLQHSDYEKSTEWLAYLMPAQYKFKDWMAMVRAIQTVIDVNVFRGKEKQTYMIMMSRQICWYSDNKDALRTALKWIGEVIAGAEAEELPRLQEERSQIEEKLKEL